MTKCQDSRPDPPIAAQDDYWLYVVENAATDSPQLYTIQNPASHFSPEEILGAVRYVIKDWKGDNG